MRITLDIDTHQAYTLLDLVKDHAADMSDRLNEALDREDDAVANTNPETNGAIGDARCSVDIWTKRAVKADALLMQLRKRLGKDFL